MVIIAGTSMNALKKLTLVFTMHIAMTPMEVSNVNVKPIGFYELVILNVGQMYVPMVIMDTECIASKCLIMQNARNVFTAHYMAIKSLVLHRSIIGRTNLVHHLVRMFRACILQKNNLSYMIAKIVLRMIDAKIIFVKWDMVMTVHLQPIPISLKGLKGMFAKEKL